MRFRNSAESIKIHRFGLIMNGYDILVPNTLVDPQLPGWKLQTKHTNSCRHCYSGFKLDEVALSDATPPSDPAKLL